MSNMSRIEDYALIGDLLTAGLVSNTGSIDWLCLPRFDSSACFAALIGGTQAGHWELAPVDGGRCTRRRYRENTLILETDWQTGTGSVRVIDFMPPRADAPDVVRIVVGLGGHVDMRGVLRLRFDYGRVLPWVRNIDGRLVAVAGPDSTRLVTPAPLVGEDWSTISAFTVRKGDRVPFVMTWSPSWESPPKEIDAEAALMDTEAYWRDWNARGSRVDGPYRSAIKRSLITLKALTHQPTGGIVAAPTTSLPEQIGGPRNWDYRYCWLRDATFALQALVAAGYHDEANDWREWLLRAVAGNPADLQIMYGIDGTRRLPEHELHWLDGYESSTPVRIGNAASGQRQLDVWGEILDGLALARDSGLVATDDAWRLQVGLMNYVEGNWKEPDNGLWEIRGPRQHFTHSKVMAWVAADRMTRTIRKHPALTGPLERWEALRDEIRREILQRAFDPKRNTFVQAYEGSALDASLLLIPRVGLLAGDDSRVLGTIEAIQRELSEDGLVRRYSTAEVDDGLAGGEGMFFACTFWLVDALHLAGRRAEATDLFERLLDMRNDVGLLSEEWDPVGHRFLGNFPQAFSHFPLVTSALQLHVGRGHRSHEPIVHP